MLSRWPLGRPGWPLGFSTFVILSVSDQGFIKIKVADAFWQINDILCTSILRLVHLIYEYKGAKEEDRIKQGNEAETIFELRGSGKAREP